MCAMPLRRVRCAWWTAAATAAAAAYTLASFERKEVRAGGIDEWLGRRVKSEGLRVCDACLQASQPRVAGARRALARWRPHHSLHLRPCLRHSAKAAQTLMSSLRPY